jgi:hypothetical protein
MRHWMTRFKWESTCAVLVAALVLLAAPAAADFSIGYICKDIDLCMPPNPSCSASGFKITLTAFSPANPSDGGVASYTYTICSPPAGVCTGTARGGESCLDNNFCRKKGQVRRSGRDLHARVRHRRISGSEPLRRRVPRDRR